MPGGVHARRTATYLLLVSVPAERRGRPGRWPPPKLPSTRRCRQLDRSTSRGGAASAVSKIRVSSDVPEPSSTTVSAALRRAMSSARSTSLKSHPERSHPARSANDRSGWTLLSVLLHSFQARGATTSQPLMHEGCHCLAMVQRRCACRKLRPPWSGPRRRSSLIVGGPDVRGLLGAGGGRAMMSPHARAAGLPRYHQRLRCCGCCPVVIVTRMPRSWRWATRSPCCSVSLAGRRSGSDRPIGRFLLPC